MDFVIWKDVLNISTGFVLSIIAGLIGAFIQRKFDQRNETHPLNQLLNFGRDDLLFIFPHREEITEAILPRTSTEDFVAMNNFISALINAGWTRKIGVRDTTRVSTNDKKRNLVIVCSPKSNGFSEEFQMEQKKQLKKFFYFEKDTDERWFITDGNGEYKSKSYKQVDGYRSAGIDKRELPTKSFEDYAVITKATNPWNYRNKVILIAGIRGIGTWGAAECVKKEWRQIYKLLPQRQKDVDFSALVKIRYHNCDITAIDILRVLYSTE